MFKLLIVDDEPLVQVGIRSMLDWSSYGIEVVETASNGAQAMKIIDEKHPEIVITDIKMPVMDGLELIRECRSKYGSELPEFIFLTSYEDFGFVKEAIRNQASDYLIKVELTKDALLDTLTGVLERVKKKSAPAVSEPAGLVDNLYDKFFIRLLNNLFESEEQFNLLCKDLSLDFSYSGYVCCYGKFDDVQKDSLPLEKRLGLFANSIQMVKELAGKYMPCYCVSLDGRHFAIIFCLDGEASPDSGIRGRISAILESISDSLTKYYNVSFAYGIGRFVKYPQIIFESCKSARDELKAILSSGEGEGLTENTDAANHIVRNVKKYIKEHIREKLSLNDVSARFGISPNYLSQLFSKYNDTGFSEYINICKIKESKLLLSKENLKVYEVADLMGFESSFYFSKVFKKYEGISPTEYINQI